MHSSNPNNTPEWQDGEPSAPAPEALSPQQSGPTPALVPPPAPPPQRDPFPGGQENFQTPLGWYDLLYLAAFYLGAGILLTLVVSAVAIVAFGVSPGVLRQSIGAQSSILIVAQGLLSGATIAFLYVLIRGRTAAPFWPALGWHSLGRAASRASTVARFLLGGFGLAVLVGILGRYVSGSAPVPMEELFRSRQSVLLLTALGILVAPLVEETIFRGCIYPVVARRFGLNAGVLVTGTLFGLAHAQQLGGAVGQISLLILVGIILTYIRARTGTVVASYLVHLGYNTFLFAGFYLFIGLKHLPGS